MASILFRPQCVNTIDGYDHTEELVAINHLQPAVNLYVTYKAPSVRVVSNPFKKIIPYDFRKNQTDIDVQGRISILRYHLTGICTVLSLWLKSLYLTRHFTWWPLLEMLSWYPLILVKPLLVFDDRVSVDEIYISSLEVDCGVIYVAVTWVILELKRKQDGAETIHQFKNCFCENIWILREIVLNIIPYGVFWWEVSISSEGGLAMNQ